jgi:proline racemase
MYLTTLDAHVAGGAVRLVTSGLPRLEGSSLQERSESFVRLMGVELAALGREPRGHDGTVVAMFAEPDRPDADAGLLFVSAHGPIMLCGHGLLGATAIGLSRGLIVPRDVGAILLDTLAGGVSVRATDDESLPARVSYSGPPARVIAGNRPVVVGRRSVHADLVKAGADVLAIVDAEAAGVPLVASRMLELQRGGLQVLNALDGDDVGGVVFIGIAPEGGVDVRSATVYTDGVVERSPGGSSTVALAAVLTAMGALAMGQRLVHQGLFGATLEATVNALLDAETGPAFEVEVAGDVWPTGEHEFVFNEGNPTVSRET